jgi:hypothetical protein
MSSERCKSLLPCRSEIRNRHSAFLQIKNFSGFRLKRIRRVQSTRSPWNGLRYARAEFQTRIIPLQLRVGSLPRHFGYESRYGAARNHTLRENAEFIDKARNHKAATTRQGFQGFLYDILGRLINET